jgi:hypothetical protein
MNGMTLINKTSFCEKLKSQIESFPLVADKQINSENELENLKKEVRIWSDFNQELLNSSFISPENQYSISYKKILPFGSIGGTKTVLGKYKDLVAFYKRKLQYLESLLNRIDLIN